MKSLRCPNRSCQLQASEAASKTVAGANAIIALRCCKLGGRSEDFWERRAAAQVR